LSLSDEQYEVVAVDDLVREIVGQLLAAAADPFVAPAGRVPDEALGEDLTVGTDDLDRVVRIEPPVDGDDAGRQQRTTTLDDGPPVNFCKPAVDPLFTSATEIWQGGVMAVVLTGMGSDGARGGKDIVAAGGSVIAQDEATSVVWGMPGAAANAGICAAVLPLNQIAPKLVRFFAGDRS